MMNNGRTQGVPTVSSQASRPISQFMSRKSGKFETRSYRQAPSLSIQPKLKLRTIVLRKKRCDTLKQKTKAPHLSASLRSPSQSSYTAARTVAAHAKPLCKSTGGLKQHNAVKNNVSVSAASKVTPSLSSPKKTSDTKTGKPLGEIIKPDFNFLRGVMGPYLETIANNNDQTLSGLEHIPKNQTFVLSISHSLNTREVATTLKRVSDHLYQAGEGDKVPSAVSFK